MKKKVIAFGNSAHIILPKSMIGKEVNITSKDNLKPISKQPLKVEILTQKETAQKEEKLDVISIYNKLMHTSNDSNDVRVDSNSKPITIEDLESFMIADLKKLVYTPMAQFEKACYDLKSQYEELNKSLEAQMIIEESIKRKKEYAKKNKEGLSQPDTKPSKISSI